MDASQGVGVFSLEVALAGQMELRGTRSPGQGALWWVKQHKLAGRVGGGEQSTLGML